RWEKSSRACATSSAPTWRSRSSSQRSVAPVSHHALAVEPDETGGHRRSLGERPRGWELLHGAEAEAPSLRLHASPENTSRDGRPVQKPTAEKMVEQFLPRLACEDARPRHRIGQRLVSLVHLPGADLGQPARELAVARAWDLQPHRGLSLRFSRAAETGQEEA